VLFFAKQKGRRRKRNGRWGRLPGYNLNIIDEFILSVISSIIMT
jgi:hypothetical protein